MRKKSRKSDGNNGPEKEQANGSLTPPDRSEEDAVSSTTNENEAPDLEPEAHAVYRAAIRALNESGVTYAVGAAFARHAYTGIWRPTKDLDVFVKPEELKTAMESLENAGFQTEVKAEHWLAKAHRGDFFIDLIFGTGHGQLPINDDSFRGCQVGEILRTEAPLIPIEEMIASAAYVAGRRRFDGVDIIHLIRGAEGKLDWQRILDRLGEDRVLLLWHLILFDYVYPGHSDYLPQDLMRDLFDEVQKRWENPGEHEKAFRGTLLDPHSFNVDVEDWGYEDRRDLRSLVDEQGEML
jgi:hypothetical protein